VGISRLSAHPFGKQIEVFDQLECGSSRPAHGIEDKVGGAKCIDCAVALEPSLLGIESGHDPVGKLKGIQ
jgi:hypothetical protein